MGHLSSAEIRNCVVVSMSTNGSNANSNQNVNNWSNSNNNRTPQAQLFGAIQNGNLARVRELLNSGQVNTTTRFGNWSPLFTAAAGNGGTNMIRLLLNRGANVNSPGYRNAKPLHAACRDGKRDVAQMLIQAGAAVNSRDDYDLTPLHMAVLRGHMNCARLLLENGALINARDNQGNTPFLYACINARMGFIRYLAREGADVNVRGTNGDTPLSMVLSSVRFPTVTARADALRFLMRIGAVANRQDMHNALARTRNSPTLRNALTRQFPGGFLNMSTRRETGMPRRGRQRANFNKFRVSN